MSKRRAQLRAVGIGILLVVGAYLIGQVVVTARVYGQSHCSSIHPRRMQRNSVWNSGSRCNGYRVTVHTDPGRSVLAYTT